MRCWCGLGVVSEMLSAQTRVTSAPDWPDYLRRSEIDVHPLLAGLGPEPLEPGFSGRYLNRVLAGKMTPIKSAMLDQPPRKEKSLLVVRQLAIIAAFVPYLQQR